MICFYHKGDLDGHCAGAIVRNSFPKALMIGINYEDSFPWDLPEIQEDSEGVIMVDFAFPKIEDMQRLYHISQRFIWIDHHKTAIDKAREAGFNPPGLREVGKAACELTWNFFYPHKTMPLAVWLLGRYDVFDLEADRLVLPFQYGMRTEITDPALVESIPLWKDLFAIEDLMGFEGGPILEIAGIGERILTYQALENAKLMARQAFVTLFHQMPALVVNHGPGSSMKFESCHKFEPPKSYHILISFARLPQQKWLVNLYTYREDVDCGEIARRHGGGGHRKAAGFICEELPFKV